MEFRRDMIRNAAGFALPAGLFAYWILQYGIYNWVFTSIIKPPRGVEKRKPLAE